MAKVIILTTLLLHLFFIMVQGIIVKQQSTDCSRYFTDTRQPGISNLLGRIEIPPPPINDEYYLKVALDTYNEVKRRNSIGNRNYRLELGRTIDETIRAVSQSKPLLYNIYYPINKPIPTVSAIWLNNQRYCPGLEANENIHATIELGHIVYPPNKDAFSWTWYRNSSSYRIDNPSSDRLTISSLSPSSAAIAIPSWIANNECGVTEYYTDSTNRLIPNGQEIFAGQWPWLVTFDYKNLRNNHYFVRCTGSVLTTRHIITAAQCLKENGTTNNIHADHLRVSLGRHNTYFGEEGVNRKVASYMIHPDYAHATSGDSDLAILVMNEPVEFNSLIKPICLWFGSHDLQNIVNKKGYLVGLDQTGSSYTFYPRMTRVPIVSQETCLRSNQKFYDLTSDRTFCAGERNESGPCHDQGAGLVIFDDTTGRYHLRGIVSRDFCKIEDYVVYVDVAKYISWIQQQISIP
ncbi:serine protease gd [Monomorium pharaonis]|uniref:serine protease gd n=1 Tax=Monomorium pharaonis TaxID=307658 RepID=UPI00063ED73E|nr:serine protease gd [Monomorium pharaonis]